MKGERSEAPVAKERCRDCQHFEHEPGDCKNCNCGESAIIGRGPGYEGLAPDLTGKNLSRGMGGRRGWAPPSD
jgi:hypothetical protein